MHVLHPLHINPYTYGDPMALLAFSATLWTNFALPDKFLERFYEYLNCQDAYYIHYFAALGYNELQPSGVIIRASRF